ncbi:MAG TPA: hypothetical protein VFH74_15555 [Gaiellales bacterium]|nr:hypothetical protein [Gaiellales bacterium]
MSRFVVLEEHSPAAVAAVADELAADGAQIVRGWRKPIPGVQLVCVGTVRSPADAAAAVMCAVDGARLVVVADAERDLIDSLCDDLRHLGRLDHRIGEEEVLELPEDHRQLLALLLGGATLGQAAQALHISRRTADRRLAAARALLGAQTTSEAVAAASRLGVRPAQRH